MSINTNYNYNYDSTNTQYYSQINPSFFKSVSDQAQLNSVIKNIQSETPIKFSKPKYTQVEDTYQELAPITNQPIEMPTRQSKKIKTMEPIIQKTILLEENVGVSQIFNNDNLYNDIPLPTNSVINNLMKDSVVQSNFGPDIQTSMNNYKIENSSKINNNISQNNNINNSNYSNNFNSNYKSNMRKTKYEQRLIQEEQERIKKQSMAMKQ